MVHTLHTEIEIDRSPEEVRKVFLDFPKYSEWHGNYTIKPPDGKTVLQTDDVVTLTANGLSFHPKVVHNTPEELRWAGITPYILTGEHYYRFEPSQKKAGSTRFVHAEDYSGWLSFLFGPTYYMGRQTTDLFTTFNEKFKKAVEAR